MLCSAWGADWLMLNVCLMDEPVEKALEMCLNGRQLALQRSLQGRDDEALALLPCGYVYAAAGHHQYVKGAFTVAVELLQTAYGLASQEGRPRLMMLAKVFLGNCYSGLRDVPNTERHYETGLRLAKSLGDGEMAQAIRYNAATTCIETGKYEEALGYFESLPGLDMMDGQKLAICYEKLNRTEEARVALERSENRPNEEVLVEDARLMRDVVRYRLSHPAYLQEDAYGTLMTDCFARCRRLSSGYALFHLPWMLEWYEAQRQYKQAYLLLREFS